jgi:hypothetical protein
MCWVPWLRTWGAGRFVGVGNDAEFIAGRIDERLNAGGAPPLRMAI